MNIFNNIKRPEDFAAERKAAHEAYLKRRGITEEEYQREEKERERKENEENRRLFLNHLIDIGMTEEEYNKKQKKEERKKKLINKLKFLGSLALIYALVIIFIAWCFSEDVRDLIEPIAIIGGGIMLLYIFIMMCAPLWLIFESLFESSKFNKYLKHIIILILTLISVYLIFYACDSIAGSKSSSDEYYEPGKLRPDKF